MKITSVRYEQLKSDGNFNNQKVGVEVSVGYSDSPEECMRFAKDWVSTQLGVKPENWEDKIKDEVANRLRDMAASLTEPPF